MSHRPGHGNEYTGPEIPLLYTVSYSILLLLFYFRKQINRIESEVIKQILTSMYSSWPLICKCQSNLTAVEFIANASFSSTTLRRALKGKKREKIVVDVLVFQWETKSNYEEAIDYLRGKWKFGYCAIPIYVQKSKVIHWNARTFSRGLIVRSIAFFF